MSTSAGHRNFQKLKHITLVPQMARTLDILAPYDVRERRRMREAGEILQSYMGLLARLTGAASVSLYVPPEVTGAREVLVHDGRVGPLPELADAETAAELHSRVAVDETAGNGYLARSDAEGLLYRIPLRWATSRGEEEAGSTERRKRDGKPRERTAWVGLRFEQDGAEANRERPWLAAAADAIRDESWWKGFFALAAAFADHARSVSRLVFDQVTDLPERTNFQAALEAALAHAKEKSRPAVLVLLGPDDFGWVNDRLDRRAGDLVLREIASVLRGSVRTHDHIARYGGAIFSVILLDTTPEEGRMVAENVVRRLRDHRYHGGILHLDFSAGLAVADTDEPVDFQELIRRADQALSAAKRSSSGAVRIWERGTDVERARSLDRLQGIFTGDKSKDYRNMKLLMDSVAVVAASTDPAELARSFAERLLEALHARRVGVFERSRTGGLELLGGLERSEGALHPFRLGPRDLEVVERACQEGNFAAEGGEEPGALSLFALPLLLQGRRLGGLVLEVEPATVSFEGSDRRFLDALASEMAVALDRVRLIGRERDRQRAEKEQLEAEVTDLRRVVHGSRLAYRSRAMESLLETARKVARTDATVLITGESGTGKELLAHTLHELSARHDKPVVVVDCGAISPTLIESELFGHEKGAFTGAHARKPGRLAQADGATVFLDEIGELPLDLQSKLLRFVQEKQFTPVGSVTARRVDVRIIAATNVDLRAKVAQGRFREDLFHRLNVVRLHVPPLRERKHDIVHLAAIFLQQFAALYRRPAHHFTVRAEEELERHPWLGNVRELQNLVLTSVLFCDAAEVDVDDLQGFQGSAAPLALPGLAAAAPALAHDSRGVESHGKAAGPSKAAQRLRQALGEEIAALLASPGGAPLPVGKWLTAELVLTADRLAGGVNRRGAALLGLPETTYRRQLRSASRQQAAGLHVRSPRWPAVASALEEVIQARRDQGDTCEWVEACLLAEVEVAAPGDARTASSLLGVTEPTLMRRKAECPRHLQENGAPKF
jgi:diguanylate cyclase (GGDEF)-like protein